uniref:BRMS1 like transcriptional repressor n=1 Tax=Seriola lalandi dorsalis TaxID=1841481 RepID=A0A3B4YQH7_SERLL
MPVHRDREKKESTAEEMEVEDQEQDASSSEEEDSDTSSVSEDGDSSEMDEEDCERRRMECLDEMSNLEKQFTDLKDQLYRERLSQVNSKLAEVEAGRAAEYLEPLAVLLENMQVRTKVAGIYRELCLESVKNKYQCEIQAACQHWESEKLLLFDTVQNELEEKIRRLEEDRHSIDITSELWNDELSGRKKRRDALSPDKKRRRPSVVSDILLLLIPLLLFTDSSLNDWTAIRKAVATLGPHRGKSESDSSVFPFRQDRNRPILNLVNDDDDNDTSLIITTVLSWPQEAQAFPLSLLKPISTSVVRADR